MPTRKYPLAPMTVAERIANESKLFIDAYVVAMRQPVTANDPARPAFKAQAAVEAYRFWLVESGYVDLDDTE